MRPTPLSSQDPFLRRPQRWACNNPVIGVHPAHTVDSPGRANSPREQELLRRRALFCFRHDSKRAGKRAVVGLVAHGGAYTELHELVAAGVFDVGEEVALGGSDVFAGILCKINHNLRKRQLLAFPS